MQFTPQHPGDVGRLTGSVLSYGHNVKHAIVVDDVTPFNMDDVMRVIGTRVDARRKAWIETHLSTAYMDPSAQAANESNESVGGLVIDATRPVGKPFLPGRPSLASGARADAPGGLYSLPTTCSALRSAILHVRGPGSSPLGEIHGPIEVAVVTGGKMAANRRDGESPAGSR